MRYTPLLQVFIILAGLANVAHASLQPTQPKARTSYEVVNSAKGQATLERVRQRFEQVGVDFPPSELTLLATKNTRNLEVWAKTTSGQQKYIHSYRVLGASGGPGPKLKRGDKQVPEGLYRITRLNPNSAYHLSLKINYPNQFDRQMARRDQRYDLGSDIFIHGSHVSRGCLAIGNTAIEELFVTVHAMNNNPVQVLIAPHDPRQVPLVAEANQPSWTANLYRQLNQAFDDFYYLKAGLAEPASTQASEDKPATPVVLSSLPLSQSVKLSDSRYYPVKPKPITDFAINRTAP